MELTAVQRMELVSAVSVGHDGSVSTRAQIVLAWHGNESATDIAVSVSGSVGQVSDVGLELPRSHVDDPGRPAVRTFSSAGNTGGLAMTIRFLRGQVMSRSLTRDGPAKPTPPPKNQAASSR